MARRRYLIEPGFQLKFTALIVGIAVALIAILGTLYVRARSEQSRLMGINRLCLGGQGNDLDQEFDAELRERLDRDDTLATIGLVGGAVVLVGVLALVGIRLTFHVVGPARAVSAILWGMSEGNLTVRRRLRRGDELSFLQDDLATLQEALAHQAEVDAAMLEEAAMAVRGAGGDEGVAARLTAAAQERRRRAGKGDEGKGAEELWFKGR